MNSILLLGAGFSRNWRGWLSDEVFDYILSSTEVMADSELHDIVWRNSDAGFESALEHVQQDAIDDPISVTKRSRLNAMQAVLERMFGAMNNAFLNQVEFEFHRSRNGTVREFLAQFDVIFTLNQDLLIEHHYVDTFNISLELPRRWDSVQIPGMSRGRVSDPMFDRSWTRAQWKPLPDAEYLIAPRCQPYIKLHGSSNWVSSKGQRLLVMGGNKPGQIQRHKILSRYALELQARLRKPNTRLMVIGYGFRDHHINQEIGHAVYDHGLKMFVISPQGRNLAKVLNSPTHPGIPLMIHGYDLEDIFRRSLMGVSQRSLAEIFGGDTLEHAKVMSFLQ